MDKKTMILHPLAIPTSGIRIRVEEMNVIVCEYVEDKVDEQAMDRDDLGKGILVISNTETTFFKPLSPMIGLGFIVPKGRVGVAYICGLEAEGGEKAPEKELTLLIPGFLHERPTAEGQGLKIIVRHSDKPLLEAVANAIMDA